MSLNDDIDVLLHRELPDSRKVLSSNIFNLQQIANYCDENYIQADNKNQALAETKNFATQSLAHVAYQIHKMASDVITLLDLQVDNVSDLESSVNILGQTVAVHKEKVARREIGVLTTNKTTNRVAGSKGGIVFPNQEETPRKYVRTGIEYDLLDNIGHGVKVQPTVRRSNSQRAREPKLHANIPLTGTISRQANLSRQVSAISAQINQYRIPIAAPNVPSHYAPGHYTGQKATPPTTPTINKHSDAFISGSNRLLPMPGLDPNFTDGSVSPPLPPPPPVEYSPYAPPTSNVQRQSQQSLPPHTLPPSPMTQNNATPITRMSTIGHRQSAQVILPPPMTSNNIQHNDIQHNDLHRNPSVHMPPPTTTSIIEPFVYQEPIFIEKVRAIYDYNKDKDDELTFNEGSIIFVTKKNDDGWYEGVLDGITGLFPGNYVETM